MTQVPISEALYTVGEKICQARSLSEPPNQEDGIRGRKAAMKRLLSEKFRSNPFNAIGTGRRRGRDPHGPRSVSKPGDKKINAHEIQAQEQLNNFLEAFHETVILRNWEKSTS